ncbi:MAG TPA: ATP-binding protein [Bryobacteraceae bacterium]|nr:ATP-binding protein [Bryobacteraceae bacterium]
MSRFNTRSLRFRLTLWYSCALILVAFILAGASRWALAVSLDHALDQSLRYRLIGLHGFIEENSDGGLDRLATRLRELNTLGELFQVFGPNGELMAQSDGLTRHHVGSQLPPDPGAGMLFRAAGPRWFPVRMATQRIYVDGQPLIIEVADPRGKFQSLLNEFYSVLYVAIPIALIVATLGGYWLSGRALAPVDQIIDEARSIDSANLAARLSVPSSGDELQRLSETLNQMLDRVEHSVLHVRRFTADASHELRAPMTLIYTAAQFALRRDRDPEELKESLRKILREAKRCTELINHLLLLARSDAGGSQMQIVPTDIGALVEDVKGEVSMLASTKRLNVSSILPEQPVFLSVDATSFRRMLLILLDNAIKYTPEGGAITISLIEEPTNVAIAVADTGVGIPTDQLPFIFDRFWRADKVRSRDAGGTGLGLAIAREIAQSHGAELTAESSIGIGSTFTVRLRRSTTELSPVHISNEQTV